LKWKLKKLTKAKIKVIDNFRFYKKVRQGENNFTKENLLDLKLDLSVMLRNLGLIYPKTRGQDNRFIHMEEQIKMFIA
tara:strand:- start:981 stop:1214 length:234 start_codon:yes stop_codon:yes gene_type:complete